MPTLEQSLLPINGWEIVIFVYPVCPGTCAHCWSSESFFGRPVALEWYNRFFGKINFSKVREVRLSGGEPLLYPELGKLLNLINNYSQGKTAIKIFTAGLGYVSLTKPYQGGITETIDNFKSLGIIKPRTSIHLSADENHAGSLFRYVNGIKRPPCSLREIRKENLAGIDLLANQSQNFLGAMSILSEQETSFEGGKLKIHAERRRLEKHRQRTFSWMKKSEWNNSVESSEGLFDSGRAAKNFQGNIKIIPGNQVSLFVIPGAEFYYEPISRISQPYSWENNNHHVAYLDYSKNGFGAAIIGFWNMIGKKFYGGTAMEIAEKYLT